MRHWIQAFSLGLLTATAIIGITYFYFDEPKTVQTKEMTSTKPISQQEMKNQLSQEGYHILSSEEFQALTDSSSSESEDPSKKEKKEVIVKYTIDIAKGMNSLEVSQLLKKRKIIDDVKKFNRYLEVNGYDHKIILGEVNLDSTMSKKEIAEAISKK